MLWVFFNEQQARAYQQNNRPGANIVTFKVWQSVKDEIYRQSIPQNQKSQYPDRPQISDPHFPDGRGLPQPWIDELMHGAVPKTDGILAPVGSNGDRKDEN